MNSRSRNLSRWAAAVTAAALFAGSGGAAWAQYGGRSNGGNFDAPRDVRANTRNYRAPQAQSAQGAHNPGNPGNDDRYNPQTWLSRQGWSDGVQQAGGPGSQQRGAVRQASYNHRQMQGEEVMPMEEGMMFGPGPEEEYWGGQPPGSVGYDGQDGGCQSCGDGGSCGGGSCGDSCGNACGDSCGQCKKVCCMPCFLPDYFEVFAGPQGFKGPRDYGQNGNFGFHEGINASGPLGFIPCGDLNYQIGWQAVQSNLSGTVFDDAYRRQYFVTAGVFHRQDCGLNYGAVWDWQRDQFYDDIDVNQLRGQVSLMSPMGREIGFMAAVATNDDLGQGFGNGLITLPAATWEVNDQFLGFYRWNFDCGGDFRAFGGFTGSKDGVVGSDFYLPFHDSWAMSGGFTYVIPDEKNQGPGAAALGSINEQWNISLSLTYVFGAKARNQGCSSPRPMFNVADNGSMLVQMQEAP